MEHYVNIATRKKDMSQVRDETLEKLIEMVRECDFVYNMSDRKNCDPYLVESFWQNVAEALNEEDMDAYAWQKRWRNMRDSYVKNKRRSRETGGRPTYKFAKQMAFLDPHLPKTRLLKVCDELDGEHSLSERDDVKEETGSHCESLNAQSPDAVWSAEYDSSSVRRGIKRQSLPSWNGNYTMPPKRECMNYGPYQHDADLLLFESYALRLKALPKEAQTVIKMQMSQIFFNAENTSGDPIEILPSWRNNQSTCYNLCVQDNIESLTSQPLL